MQILSIKRTESCLLQMMLLTMNHIWCLIFFITTGTFFQCKSATFKIIAPRYNYPQSQSAHNISYFYKDVKLKTSTKTDVLIPLL